MSNTWYPILFSPIYLENDWGGTLLSEHFGRSIPSSLSKVGNSYEIIDRQEIQSVVANGAFKGKTIGELSKEYPKEFVGIKHKSSDPFPLILRYLDAGKRLPLQVHPDKAASMRIGRGSPNSKMWYVVAASEAAKILVGIKRNCTQQQFLSRLGTPEIESLIQSFPSETGDAYFISAGRIHSIDAGNLVFSVEQNSDTVYWLSDWEFEKSDGNCSTSDLEEGLNCIHFQDRTLARIRRESSTVKRNRKIPLITICPFFAVDDLRLVYELHDYTDGATFHILTAIDSAITISNQGNTVEMEMSRSCLVPASMGHYVIVPRSNPARVLKTTLRID